MISIAANPQSATGIITSALRLVGSLGVGETPTADELNDAGVILNEMLDSWNSDRVTIFAIAAVTQFSLTPSKQKYVLGQSGLVDFNYPIPPRFDRASVLYTASSSTPVEVPIEVVDDVGWQAIANKSVTSLLPMALWPDFTAFPNVNLWFWPVPTQANPITLYAWQSLQTFADLTTDYSFPPGYQEAIRMNLAVRLAAEFPGDPAKLPLLIKLAMESKNRIMSFNGPIKQAMVDRALLGGAGRGNIYTGLPSRSQN